MQKTHRARDDRVIAYGTAGYKVEVTVLSGRTAVLYRYIIGLLRREKKRYVLLANFSNASPDAIWNSHEPELTISPLFLTRRP